MYILCQDLPYNQLHCPIALDGGREAKFVRLQNRVLSLASGRATADLAITHK